MATTLAERKMKIPFDTLMEIEGVASKCKTKFSNWEDFVGEALSLFTNWWDDPKIAQKIWYGLTPHFTKEMQDFTITQMSKHPDQTEELKEYKKRVEEVKKKTSLEKMTFSRYNDQDEPEFLITGKRFDRIKVIVKMNKNQFPTPRAFFNEAVDFFFLFWTDQQKAIVKVYDMWDNMTEQMKSWMKKEYPKTYEQLEMQVAEYKKQVPQSDDKSVEPETEAVVDVSSDEVKLMEPEIQVSSGPNVQRREIHDSGATTFVTLAEGYDQTYTEIMDLKENGAWDKAEEDALPYDNYPLIWSFYSRFMPIKLVVSVLADMVSDVEGGMVNYEKFRKKAYKAAVGLRVRMKG